jgi:hypothetical protein
MIFMIELSPRPSGCRGVFPSKCVRQRQYVKRAAT